MAPLPAKVLPSLRRLGAATVAIGMAAAVLASRVTPRPGNGAADQTRRLLHTVRDEVRAARTVTPNPALHRSLRETEAALADIARVTGVRDWRALRALDDAICVPGELAVVFLSTGGFLNNWGAGSRIIEISSNDGLQEFTFASGTSQVNIIRAINGVQGGLGFQAAPSDVNPDRVAVSSTWMDNRAWVRVKLIDASWDIVFSSALSTAALDNRRDFGRTTITLSPFRP